MILFSVTPVSDPKPWTLKGGVLDRVQIKLQTHLYLVFYGAP